MLDFIFAGITPENAWGNGVLMCILALVWFVLSFITGRGRRPVSAAVYLAVGILNFLLGAAYMNVAFIESSPMEKLTTAAVFALLVAGAAVILIIGTALKNRNNPAAESGDEDFLDYNDPEEEYEDCDEEYTGSSRKEDELDYNGFE